MKVRGSALCAAGLAAALVVAGTSRASAQERNFSQEDRDVLEAYDVMQAVTLGLMGATASIGLMQLYNLPTTFGEGACARNEAIFGEFACRGEPRGLTLVHAGFALATVGSYIATAVLAFEAPNEDVGTEDTVTDVLGVVHGVGLGLTGTLGFIAANPQIFGITTEPAQREFSRHLRVVHWVLALITASAFTTHVIVDHVD